MGGGGSFWGGKFCTVNSLCNFSKDFFGKMSQWGGGVVCWGGEKFYSSKKKLSHISPDMEKIFHQQNNYVRYVPLINYVTKEGEGRGLKIDEKNGYTGGGGGGYSLELGNVFEKKLLFHESRYFFLVAF